MEQIHPTQVLMNEHRVIEHVLVALEAKLEDLEKGCFPREFFEKALDFFVNFADGCHHAKEEMRLFPALKQRGVPEQGGPIGVMLYEHEVGRAYLQTIRAHLNAAERGEPEAIGAIRSAAMGYIELLRAHILKEDNILFAIARRVLTPADVERLQKEFECVEHHHVGAGVHERYEALAEELAGATLAPRR